MTRLTPEQMHAMVRAFTAHHLEGAKDEVGPNKADAPFFGRLSACESIDVEDYIEAAERLYKYRNTQMPFMMEHIGLKYEDVNMTAFLEDMKQQGEEAREIRVKREAMEKQQDEITSNAVKEIENNISQYVLDNCPILFEAEFKSKRARRRHLNSVTIGDVDAVEEMVSSLGDELPADLVSDQILEMTRDFGKDKAQEMIEVLQEYWTEYGKKLISSARRNRFQRTIKAKLYEDVWYGKNDPDKKWPKKSKRILLRFPNEEKLRNALKNRLVGGGRFIWKPDDRAWSLMLRQDCVDGAIEVFKEQGYYTEQIEEIEVPKEEEGIVTATIQGDSVALQWPWLGDENLRYKVMGIVKGIMGRKWDAKAKVWRIPISQAAFLKGRLDGVYQPLADALSELPGLDKQIEKTAERIAISSAAALTDESVIEDMRTRIAKQFPEGKELYPFQYVGVRFVELAGGRALIGDDMGVGKTIQALAYAALHPENHPVLVVCPANVKYNWVKEFKSWLPNLTTEAVQTGKSPIPDTDVVVINYDLIKKQQLNIEGRGFNIVIFDESHYLKNAKAQRTKASLEIAAESSDVICLSGTAITNRPIEFFTTLNLLRPLEFGNFFAFAKRYSDAHHNGWGWDFNGSANEKELHERTRAFTIRRLKKEVMPDLPDKIRQIFEVQPSKKEIREYRRIHESWIEQYEMHKSTGSLPAGFVLNMLTELRHHCGLLKSRAAAEWARDYHITTGKPIIIFTHHRDVLQSVKEHLNEIKPPNTKGATISGETPSQRRQDIVDDFQAGHIQFLICSTIAAKEGLTLTEADTVLFVEREWVPGWEEQAEDRVNRIGQDAETVHAVYLSVVNTIDTKFNRVVEEKRAVVQSILDGGDIEKRSGIAKALLQAMVDAGEVPASLVKELGGKKK